MIEATGETLIKQAERNAGKDIAGKALLKSSKGLGVLTYGIVLKEIGDDLDEYFKGEISTGKMLYRIGDNLIASGVGTVHQRDIKRYT